MSETGSLAQLARDAQIAAVKPNDLPGGRQLRFHDPRRFGLVDVRR